MQSNSLPGIRPCCYSRAECQVVRADTAPRTADVP